MINFEDLKYAHKSDCNSKDSKNIEYRNSIYDRSYGCAVEYDCYCGECGAFLYSFAYGHYSI